MQVTLRHEVVDDHRHRREREYRHVQRKQVKQSLVVTHDQDREIDQSKHDHQRRREVPCQAEELLELHSLRQPRVMPHASKQLDPNLHDALGPPPLLRLEGVYLDRQLGGHVVIGQIDKVPAHQLRAI